MDDKVFKDKSIREIREYIGATIMPNGYSKASKEIRNYINSLQKELEIMVRDDERSQETIIRLSKENERLNTCVDDQERVINSLMDKKDLYRIKYNDYKYRCERAIEYIKENASWDMICHDDLIYDECDNLLNILQNGSDNNE